MGYDVAFVQIPRPADVTLPAEASVAEKLLAKRVAFDDADSLCQALLKTQGFRAGPKGSVDFMGSGLSYARLTPGEEAIHVENNCGARDLVRIYEQLHSACPDLLIHDLQSNRLHDAASYMDWWSRPL